MEKAPNKKECEYLIKLHSQVINKPWKKIKDFVYNTVKINKKKSKLICIIKKIYKI